MKKLFKNGNWYPTIYHDNLCLQYGIDPYPKFYKTQFNSNVLLHVSSHGLVECLKLLLQFDINPDVQNMYGNTALFLSSIQNNYVMSSIKTHCIQILLQYGANPNIQNNEGETALFNAILLCDRINGKYIYNIEGVNALLKAGAKVDIQDNYGFTALMNASSIGNIKGINVLINAGANPNIQNKEGFTALMYAKIKHENIPLYYKSEHIQCVISLLKAGANPNIKNIDGHTALKYTLISLLKKENKQIIKILKRMIIVNLLNYLC